MKRAFPWVDGRLKGRFKSGRSIEVRFDPKKACLSFFLFFLSSSGYGDVIQKLCKYARKYDTPVFTLYLVYWHRSRRHNETILIFSDRWRRTKENEAKRRIESKRRDKTHPLTGCHKITLSLCADHFAILFRQYVDAAPHTTSTQVQLITGT